MVKEVHVEGLDQFLQATKDYSGKVIFALFCGTPNEEGQSWCPDCVVAEPVVKKALGKITDEDAVFIHVGVGDRATWKDPNCVFRTHESLKLTGVPTLLKWGTKQRLGPEECAKSDLVEMLFSDED
jgi:hypothetical protein